MHSFHVIQLVIVVDCCNFTNFSAFLMLSYPHCVPKNETRIILNTCTVVSILQWNFEILMTLAIKSVHNLPPHLSYVSTLPDITRKPKIYVVFLSIVLVALKWTDLACNGEEHQKVIWNPHADPDHHQQLTTSRWSPLAHACHVLSTSISVFVSFPVYRMTDRTTEQSQPPPGRQR